MKETIKCKLLSKNYADYCQYKNCHNKKVNGIIYCKKHQNLEKKHYCDICKKYFLLPLRTHYYLKHLGETKQ